MTIATKQLPSAIIGTPYVAVLDASGGTPGYTWSVEGGQLPSGMSLAPTTGIISGMPTVSGNFSIGLALSDSSNPVQVKSSALTIAIAAPALKIAVSTLASAMVGTPYSQTLQTSGGTAPYSWSVTSGTLPAGLSLASSSGVISGTPTTSGTVRFTATVRDSGRPAQTNSIAISIIVAPVPLKITTVVVASATSGTAYSQTLQVSGGTPAYKWAIASGSLPAGLTLASTGTISGTPTTNGVATFTAAVTDRSTPIQIASAQFVITVGGPPLSIATPALGSATVGTTYAQSLKAIGGISPYSWSITSGSLPAGLTLALSTGVISGVPATSGTSTFVATVADSGSPTQSSSVSTRIVVAPTPVSIVASTLPSVTVGSPYSQTLQATGGTAPYNWSITSGNLPTGLTLTASTGAISGTATTSGTSSFTATVTDSSSPAQTASAARSVTIKATTLAVVPPSLPSVTVGTPYSKTLTATGGVGPYVWSITSGRLPQGLNLAPSAGTISGVPTASGVSDFTATVTDSSSPTQSAPAVAAIVVAPTLLAITSSSLTSTTVGASYSQSMQASGGSAPYTWTVTSGTLPAGLNLSQSTGSISGMPTASGKSTFTATVTDSSSPAQLTSATNTITVTPSSAPPAPLALSITTGSLPSVTVGTNYTQTLQAAGGTSPYSWQIASGQLPAGLSLSPSGTISGVPTSGSASTFTVSVTDSGSPAQTQSAGLTIGSTAAAPLTITSSALASGTTGAAYSQMLQATGGTPAYTWSISSGSLPGGMTLAATTGTISGTPSASGISNFTVTVTDNGNPAQTQSAATSITVASPGPAGPGTTWFIRPDGGTRYSVNVPTGQCDGLADAAYAGTGTNQHCAFKDFRYTWDDGSYGNYAWVIAGGDTVVIRGCSAASDQQNPDNPTCRIGWDTSSGSGSAGWCAGSQSNDGCLNPPIPAGSLGAHTRILGGCAYDGDCNPVNTYPYTSNNLAQLFGGFGVGTVLNLSDTQWVDIAGLEITSHNGACSRVGAPANPRDCIKFPANADDYDAQGVTTDNATANVTITDVYVHGHGSSGFYGPIGGAITLTRVFSGFNAFAGWNFDNGSDTPDAPGSSITARYVTMIGNGCEEEYPIVHSSFPAHSCWDSSSGGFGDSWSGQDTELDSFICDHCINNYNTKDAFIGPHTQVKYLTITNSQSIGNMGQSWKWGSYPGGTLEFHNNLTVGNCNRMSQALPGAAQNFAMSTGLPGSYLSNYCRAAGMVFGIITAANQTWNVSGNTVVTYQPTIFDVNCYQLGTCASAILNFEDNIILGYTLPSPYGPFGNNNAPGMYYMEDSSVPSPKATYSVEYGTRNNDCGTGATGIICSDPLLVNEPLQGTIPPEPMLDNFNFHPTSSSPARAAGVAISGLTSDFYGVTRPLAPTDGAVEP